MRAGKADIVLCESLDRLSRDQEHIASFYKQASFAGVRIVTLADGVVSEMHVGLKGMMGALYLKDLGDKTRRGLEGRVRQGRSGGGLCYGYRVLRGPVGRDGEPERGLREVEPAEAMIVRRIFEAFAAGTGPKAIANGLNRDQVPGPSGGLWQAGAIRGQAGRETGLLRNRLYIGELVWNQRHWVKDPTTGRRLGRRNPADAVVTEEVSHLRIVEQGLWDRAQVRLETQRAAWDPANEGGPARPRFWEQKRPQHLLTGRVFCGECGKPFASIGADYLACRVATADGPCSNRLRIKRGPLQAQVIEALGSSLMQADMVAEFVGEFTREWNRLAAEASAGAEATRRELDGVCRKLANLIEAITDGLRAPGLQGKLDSLEARKAALEAEVAAAGRPSPVTRLHPNLAQVYREKAEALTGALSSGGGPEVLEAVRALIERV